jgi:hypothetical protein
MIAVRLATLDDAEVIERHTASLQQMHNEALPSIFKPPSAELFSAQKLAALVHDPNCIVAVAEMGGRIVGHIYSAVVNRSENAFNGKSGHLGFERLELQHEEFDAGCVKFMDAAPSSSLRHERRSQGDLRDQNRISPPVRSSRR